MEFWEAALGIMGRHYRELEKVTAGAGRATAQALSTWWAGRRRRPREGFLGVCRLSVGTPESVFGGVE